MNEVEVGAAGEAQANLVAYDDKVSLENPWVFSIGVASSECSISCESVVTSFGVPGEIVVDSGAAIHVCPLKFGGDHIDTRAKYLNITGAGGQDLGHVGSRVLNLDLDKRKRK